MRPTWKELARQQIIARGIEATAHGLSRAGRLHPEARRRSRRVEIIRDVPYVGDGRREHLLDVWRLRDRDGPLPVALYLHGGGFRILSKETHWMMAQQLACAGYLVVNANYRLAPRHPFPAAPEDAARALKWTWDRVEGFGGDRDRLVLAGESAGANLVTSLAVGCAFDRPEPWVSPLVASGVRPTVVVALCGMLEVSRPERFDRTPMGRVARDRIRQVSRESLGPHAGGIGSHLDLANPLRVLEGGEVPARELPAFFASVGTADPIAEDTRRLERALARRGVPHRVGYYPGQGHAFQAVFWRPEAERSWADTLGFLSEHCPTATCATSPPDGRTAR